ncbi:hypothetical protein BDZ90DRAFT_220516 [Jaminaea rosea]|uniref:Dipeptidase n=1 Tax=Jaminaea rosea TaxID=1569628 RepID=A0A316USU8_9BASI|nr:hypothetical protein BDZ90DRAFT_220516 [Jaminaea rosea]PWN27411.1 hypothetical protein BDZ90DRAFT_220516 [Jaminaea rosea]
MLLPWKLFQASFSALSSTTSPSTQASIGSTLDRAHALLSRTPIFDGHWDLPIFARWTVGDNLAKFAYNDTLKGQIDLPRIRKGGVGSFWSIAFVECPSSTNVSLGPGPGWDWDDQPAQVVRDTLEQIDLTRQLVEYFPQDVALARTPNDFWENWKQGKVSHWIGLEGAHSLGNSLATLRTYAALGVTYLTLTHNCHNVFADAAIPAPGSPDEVHGGLSHFGFRLVKELNRLGVAVDLSHTSPKTQLETLHVSSAPVIFSHSGAKAVYDHPRNIDDEVLRELRKSERDFVVGVPFLSDFVRGAGNSTLEDVVEHAEYLAAKLGGKRHVALGSDYDGALEFSKGLEDAASYPRLVAKLMERGWTEKDLEGLASENWLRVIGKIQRHGRVTRAGGARPDMRPWHGRHDCE